MGKKSKEKAEYEIDLTKRPPRSPRVRLGGYVILPRMIDKGRAKLAGKVGEFHYNCPLDQRVTAFAGITADQLLKLLKAGKGDGEVLAWIQAHGKKRRPEEIVAWSKYEESRSPSDPETRAFFNDVHKKMAPKRGDISTWF